MQLCVKSIIVIGRCTRYISYVCEPLFLTHLDRIYNEGNLFPLAKDSKYFLVVAGHKNLCQQLTIKVAKEFFRQFYVSHRFYFKMNSMQGVYSGPLDCKLDRTN